MPKKMTPSELEFHIKSAIEQLTLLFHGWLESGNQKFLDKAKLVAYWVREYTAFLRREDSFSPQSVPRLKRGTVVVVDFGFRIGKEFGGRHFAVVIDNDNKLHSPIATVVPLFSLKPTYKPNSYTCPLKDGIYTPMLNRVKAIHGESMKIIDELNSLPPEQRAVPEARAKLAVADSLTKRAELMLTEIEHMKEGSVANTCQITTVSKMRIKRPLKKDDPLYGLRLSSEDMDTINQQLVELYLFTGTENRSL